MFGSANQSTDQPRPLVQPSFHHTPSTIVRQLTPPPSRPEDVPLPESDDEDLSTWISFSDDEETQERKLTKAQYNLRRRRQRIKPY